MKILCATCHRGALSTLLEGRQLPDDQPETDCVCERHRYSRLNGMASRLFPSLRLLVVVEPSEQVLYEYLRKALAGMEDVALVMERRQRERRSDARAVGEDRRTHDRRQEREDRLGALYRYVRFGLGWTEESSPIQPA